ncbi:MAG: PA2169 family four-helix-bundle protein [Caulobacterales bacterium]
MKITSAPFIATLISLGLASISACATSSPAPVSSSPETALQTNQDVEALNNLTAITIDAGSLYKQASDIAKNTELKSELLFLSGKRAKLADELQTKTASLGGAPTQSGQALGVGHRAFTDLRGIFENNEKVAAAEVLRGENNLVDEMSKVIANAAVSEDAKSVVRDALPGVQEDRDRVQQLSAKFNAKS